jgi:hypothetical protein
VEVAALCRKVHSLLYTDSDVAAANRYLGKLKKAVQRAPRSPLAIVRQEALALVHELQGNLARAIVHREREIQLTKRLHASFTKAIRDGRYGDSTAAELLAYSGRDKRYLQERRAVLKRLTSAARKPGKGASDRA